MRRRILLLALLTVGLLLAATEIVTTDGITTQTNFTGAISTIQTQDGTWMTGCGTNCSQELLLEFPTASGALTTGANEQAISSWMRNTGQSTAPTVTLEVYNSGSLYQTIGSASLTSSTGVTVGGTWTATGLGSGSTVQGRWTCSPGGGSPGNRASCEVDYVVMQWSYTAGGAKKRAVVIGKVIERRWVPTEGM